MRLWFYLGLMVAISPPGAATELVHHFENPSFGGSPLNGSVLLNQATAQNKLKDPAAVKFSPPSKTPIQQFSDSLQSSILSQLTRSTGQNLFDKNGNIRLGTNLEFSGFSITVSETSVNGTVSIDITDGISNTNLIVPYTQ